MAAELPLKIRVDIRDLWGSPNSTVQGCVEALEKTLGYKIIPQVEWPALYGELKERFPDKSTFVPTIIRITIAWYERLLGRIDNDVYSEWTDELLSVLSEAPKLKTLKLHIEPSEAGVTRPVAKWIAKSASFHLGIPDAVPSVSQSKLDSGFDQDFERLFPTDSELKDDWADISKDSHASTRASDEPAVGRILHLDAIARPADLLSSTAPYILIVENMRSTISVQCSHEPSLELLASYLTKWSKTNTNDSLRRPTLTVELIESDFCFGVIDSLLVTPTMSIHNGVNLNPVIILAFVEGVLGYSLIQKDGSQWAYKSTSLLK